MTPKLFKRYAADHRRLFLVDVDDVMWAATTYWAVAVPDAAHPIAQLLALYNLPLTECILDVGETLTLTRGADGVKQTEFTEVVRSGPPEDAEPVGPHCLNDEPLYAYHYSGHRLLALYALPGGRVVALNDKYRRRVEALSPGAEWVGGPDPMKPVYRRAEGQTVGLLMGVRCQTSGA